MVFEVDVAMQMALECGELRVVVHAGWRQGLQRPDDRCQIDRHARAGLGEPNGPGDGPV